MENSIIEFNLLFVVDADQLVSQSKRPSRNPQKPLPVKAGAWYLVGAGTVGHSQISTLGEARIHIPLKTSVVLRIVSATDNYGGATLLYDPYPATSEAAARDALQLSFVSLDGAVQPNADTGNGLPPVHVTESFVQANVQFKAIRPSKWALPFALYVLAANGQDQVLYGYFAISLNLLPLTTPQ